MTERQKGQAELKKIYKTLNLYIAQAMKVTIRTGDTSWDPMLFKAYRAAVTYLVKYGYLKKDTKSKYKGRYVIIKGW